MKGIRKPFPAKRKFVLDILHAAKSVPGFPVECTMNLARLEEYRKRAAVRISWVTLFTRAWALVSQEIPELRQVYLGIPWPALYEHPNAVATISVNRTDESTGSDFLIFHRTVAPESQSLVAIQRKLVHAKTASAEEVFKDGYELTRWPRIVRMFVWFVVMRCWGRKKAKKLGTFSVSTLAGEGVSNRLHPLVVTSSISYLPLDENGNCQVTIQFDHRVIDGVLAARAIKRLEQILCTEMVDELNQLESACEVPSQSVA